MQLHPAQLTHSRFEPRSHSFKYSSFLMSVDLDEIRNSSSWSLGYNKFRPFSFRDRDYLNPGTQSLKEKVASILDEAGIKLESFNCILVSSPRFFGYVFNPASFFFIYQAQRLRAVIAEVNNTFSERHLYVLDKFQENSEAKTYEAVVSKEFHVSPFFKRDGEYRFIFKDVRESLDIRINMYREQKLSFSSRVWGGSKPFNSLEAVKTLAYKPLLPILTTPRILWQAARLSMQKKIPVQKKPAPISKWTISTKPHGLIQSFCYRAVLKLFSKIKMGNLELVLPHGEKINFGDLSSPAVRLYVGSYNFFVRAALGSDIGFGESYMKGEWDADSLKSLLKLFIENRTLLDKESNLFAGLLRRIDQFRHRRQSNTISGSRKNIQAHYDLGNKFYELFLDRRMQYSSAFFSEPGLELDHAQESKISEILRLGRIRKTDSVLEIGCGWGGLAIEAVKKLGCKWTGVTISEAQYEYAKRRVEEEELEHLIEIKLCDYRHIEGSFDAIVSVEMLEAVGHEHHGEFFRQLDRLMKPNALAVVQVISIPDHRYDRYRRRTDWIQKHIFPGGLLPSLSRLTSEMKANSELHVESLKNIGSCYAKTLAAWRSRLSGRRDEAIALGFDDEFLRKWEYYFNYSEAAFEKNLICDLQIVFTREDNKRLTGAGSW